MSQFSDLLNKVVPKQLQPALSFAQAFIAPYVSVAKEFGREAVVRKVTIPETDLRKFRKMSDQEFAKAKDLRDAAANANTDLILFLADVEA